MNNSSLIYEPKEYRTKGNGGELLAFLSIIAPKLIAYNPNQVPLWCKYSLNVQEAAAYFGIGEKRLRQIAYEHRDDDFILEIGAHIRFKRQKFEEYLDTVMVI